MTQLPDSLQNLAESAGDAGRTPARGRASGWASGVTTSGPADGASRRISLIGAGGILEIPGRHKLSGFSEQAAESTLVRGGGGRCQFVSGSIGHCETPLASRIPRGYASRPGILSQQPPHVQGGSPPPPPPPPAPGREMVAGGSKNPYSYSTRTVSLPRPFEPRPITRVAGT